MASQVTPMIMNLSTRAAIFFAEKRAAARIIQLYPFAVSVIRMLAEDGRSRNAAWDMYGMKRLSGIEGTGYCGMSYGVAIGFGGGTCAITAGEDLFL